MGRKCYVALVVKVISQAALAAYLCFTTTGFINQTHLST